jgi:hypothetical protein
MSTPSSPRDLARPWHNADGLLLGVVEVHGHLGTAPEAVKVGRHLRDDPEVVRRWLVEECRPERSA